MSQALLNPTEEAAVCKKMIGILIEQRNEVDKALTTRLLDRETYLQHFGKRVGLEKAIMELTSQYNKEFNV